MSWSRNFTAVGQGNLSLPVSLAIQTVPNATGSGVGDTLLIASDPAISPDLLLDLGSFEPVGTKITPRSWVYGSGAFTLTVLFPTVEEYNVRFQDFARNLRRGPLAEVLVRLGGGAGVPLSDYEAFSLVIISEITCVGPNTLQVTFYDVLYALRSRPYAALDASNLPQTRLFHDIAGTETTTTTTWTNGSSTTITLTDASNFVTMNGTGIARFYDDDDNPIYLTFTGKSGNQLTGVSTSPQLGTASSVNVTAGNTAISSVYFNDHPLTIAERMLVSTGTSGSNGTQDVYALQAGFAIPSSWVNTSRFRLVRTKILTPSSGSYAWEFAVDDPVQDGLLWLTKMLAESGCGLHVRQGQISAWSAQSLASYDLPAFSITDDHIIGVPVSQWWSQEYPFSYNRVEIQTNGGSAESVLATTSLPANDEIIYDLSGLVRDNETQVRNLLAANLADWCHYSPEEVKLTVRGAFHGLAVGDVGFLTTSRVRGRLVSTRNGYSQRACMLIAYKPDIVAGTTSMTLSITPNDPADDYA